MFNLKKSKHTEIVSTHDYRGNSCVRCGFTTKEFITYYKPRKWYDVLVVVLKRNRGTVDEFKRNT